tara:strand:+ start:144 stop:413 length:270 start_codon:yes stop_codon:yes gene_type:complete
MATESEMKAIENEMEKHLTKVFTLMRETIDLIKEINISKYEQDEFRQIVTSIHLEKVKGHYEQQIAEKNFIETFKETFMEVLSDKSKHN